MQMWSDLPSARAIAKTEILQRIETAEHYPLLYIFARCMTYKMLKFKIKQKLFWSTDGQNYGTFWSKTNKNPTKHTQ